MKKLLLLIFIALLSFPLNIFASDLSGYAESSNPDIAKSNALKFLKIKTASRIFLKYDKTVFTNNNEFIKSNYKLLTLFKYINPSNLNTISITDNDTTKVTIMHPDPNTYIQLINSTVKKIDAELISIANENESKKLKLFQRLLNFYDEYNLYSELLSVLTVTDHMKPKVSYAQIIETVFALQGDNATIKDIAKYLTVDMDRSNVIINLITPATSALTGTQTDFSNALKLEFQDIISTRSKINDDTKYLNCFYIDNLSDIIINCDMTDNISKLSTSVAKISKSQLDKIEYKTSLELLLKKLDTPLMDRASLNILLRYIPETSALFLSATDYFYLQVKVNMPVFLQFVGYRMADKMMRRDIAYIIKPSGLNEIFINESNINKWITIGRYRVSEPVGDEIIEVYGRTIKQDNISLESIITDSILLNTDILTVSEKVSSEYIKNIGEKYKAILAINIAKK